MAQTATKINVDYDEFSQNYSSKTCESTNNDDEKFRYNESEGSSVPLQLLQSSFNSFVHTPQNRTVTLNPETSGTSRSQQRRSLPMDYRQLAGMRPKTWLVRSADRDKKCQLKRRNGLENRVDDSKALDLHEISTFSTEQVNKTEEVSPENERKCDNETVNSIDLSDSSDIISYKTKHFIPDIVDSSNVIEPSDQLDESSIASNVGKSESESEIVTLKPCLQYGDDRDCDMLNLSQSCEPVHNPVLLDHSYYSKSSSYKSTHKFVVTEDSETSLQADFSTCTVCEVDSTSVQESLCSLSDIDSSVCLLYNTSYQLDSAKNFVAAAFDLNNLLYHSVAEISLDANNSSTPGDNSNFRYAMNESSSSQDLPTVVRAGIHSRTSKSRIFLGGKRRWRNDVPVLNGYKTVRDKPDVDVIDGVNVISFKSEGQLKKYVDWQCNSTGIVRRHIRSRSRAKNSNKTDHQQNSANFYESEELEWHIGRGLIRKLSDVDMTHFGLKLQTVNSNSVNKCVLKRDVRMYSSRVANRRRRGIYSALNGTKKSMHQFQKYNLRISQVTDVAEAGEENDAMESNDVLDFVAITLTEARACSECIQSGWMERNSLCYQPGCTYGCICRLFSGRKFSRLVTCGIQPKLRVAEACIAGLTEEVSRLGFSFLVRSDNKREKARRPLSAFDIKKKDINKYKTLQYSSHGLRRRQEKVNEHSSSKKAIGGNFSTRKLLANATEKDCASSKRAKRLRIDKFSTSKQHNISIKNDGANSRKASGGNICSPKQHDVAMENDCTSSRQASGVNISSLKQHDIATENVDYTPVSVTDVWSPVVSLTLENDLIQPSVSSSTSTCSISSITDNCHAVSEDRDQMRTPVPDTDAKIDSAVVTDTLCGEKLASDNCGTECSPTGSQSEQAFRKQMVLFQHNQNCGRPCLLEITSNCNWDCSRSSVLGRLFAVTADSFEYPPICKFVVDGFRIEIRPRAGQKTSIPFDLRAKLGVSKMYAVRVRITVDIKTEVMLEQPRRSTAWSAVQSESTVGNCAKDVTLLLGNRTVSSSTDMYAHCRLPENISGRVF